MDNQLQSAREVLGPEMYEFLNSCIEEKGMGQASSELKEEMILDLAERLQAWLMQSVAKTISGQDAEALDKLTEQGASQQDIMAFLKQHIPNIEELFAQGMQEFKQTYLQA